MTDSGSVVGVTGHTPSALELDRRAFRRGRERRSVLMAVASTLVFAAIVWVTVINTPGWTKVQETFFDPATAWEALPKVWDGFLVNLQDQSVPLSNPLQRPLSHVFVGSSVSREHLA